MKFTHLHTHSHYSLLQALPKLDQLIAAAKKHGQTALALTDNGNLYGAIEFYKECKDEDLKPIIGVDAYMAGRTRHDKQTGVDKDRSRLILLVKNDTGYKNLLKIITASFLEGFYYKPRIDFELLEKYNEGLIAISSSYSGDISSSLRARNPEKALDLLEKYKSIFNKNGEENFFIEITLHPELSGHDEHMKLLINFAKENNVGMVASHDVYYINPEDREAKNTLMAVMQGGEPKARGGAFGADEEEDFSFIPPEEIEKRFIALGEEGKKMLENNITISESCNLEMELGKWVFPNLDIPSGKTADEELKELAYAGIKKRGMPESPEIMKRLNYELEVIKTKGYSPYFLVVADLLHFAHDNGILSNIRGSVSGSLTTYVSGITNIDPLEYEIPFERFLNPDRPSAPDIDMDYADNRRDEMVEYAKRKYGADKVAQIGTFGTMMARGSVRDTARALNYSYNLGDTISKLIPMGAQGFPMTIDRALAEVPELLELYKSDADSKRIIDMAKKIEGCARHISVHAAGIVMAPTPLTDFTALQFDTKGENKIITQYDMYSIEEAGLLKFDFLGLANLSIIANAVALVKKIKDIDVDPNNIPMDDKKTFEMLARGETEDLFQLNGDGMTRFLVELKPSNIHDINAMVALYRPGPMQFIPTYIECKHDPSKVKYLDPLLEPILKKTHGVLVYQDDLLMIAHNIAGYTWGEVDKFRKAVGKKIPEEMALQRDKFVKGSMEHSNWTEKKAKQVWSWIEPFAAYGFNKAHSVSYGRVAYQTAYLKANFPGEYMTAVLSSELGETEKVAASIAECKRMNLEVLPPDINESYREFAFINGRIRFGLGSIKNFGEGIADIVINERKQGGPFKTLEEFLTRVQDRNVNKKSMEALIKAGAFDALGERGRMLGNIENILTYNKQAAASAGQDSLFAPLMTSGYTSLYMAPTEPAAAADKLLWEKELLGLYISGHPLDKFREKLEAQNTTIKKVKEMKEGETVVIGGILEEVKPYLTKKGDKMLFTKIADLSDSIDMAVFPKTLSEFPTVFEIDACVAIKAKVTVRNGEKSLVAEKAKRL